MIAVDTNLLVYAHRSEAEWHDRAAARIRELAEGRSPWAIPWPCVHEFLAIATHPRIWDPPTPIEAALDQVEASWRRDASRGRGRTTPGSPRSAWRTACASCGPRTGTSAASPPSRPRIR